METHQIEAQIKDLQGDYVRAIRKEMKDKLADIDCSTGDGARAKTAQIQYLLDIIRRNSATWSGGAASVTNMLETLSKDIATDILHSLNLGLL